MSASGMLRPGSAIPRCPYWSFGIRTDYQRSTSLSARSFRPAACRRSSNGAWVRARPCGVTAGTDYAVTGVDLSVFFLRIEHVLLSSKGDWRLSSNLSPGSLPTAYADSATAASFSLIVLGMNRR